jgi:hypothetical protein
MAVAADITGFNCIIIKNSIGLPFQPSVFFPIPAYQGHFLVMVGKINIIFPEKAEMSSLWRSKC